MSVIMFSHDLLVGSQVSAAARQHNLSCSQLRKVDDCAAKLAEPGTCLLLIDLTTPGLAIDELMQRVPPFESGGPKTIAFGPHVMTDKLEAAAAAGCQSVLTRGQFLSQLGKLFAAAPSHPAS